MISEKELEIIDMPKSHLKVKHPKTGVEGYRVGLEVFHQLHCINMLRKATHKDHYMKFGGDFVEGQDSQLRMHLGILISPKIQANDLLIVFRSLSRDSKVECPMQRWCWTFHLLPASRRSTAMARTWLLAPMSKLRQSSWMGERQFSWQHGDPIVLTIIINKQKYIAISKFQKFTWSAESKCFYSHWVTAIRGIKTQPH